MEDYTGNTHRLTDWTELTLGNREQLTYVNGGFFF